MVEQVFYCLKDGGKESQRRYMCWHSKNGEKEVRDIVLTRRMHQPKFKYLIVRENSYMSSLSVSRSKNCSRERWGSYGSCGW